VASGSTPHEANSSVVAVKTPNVRRSSAAVVVLIADLPPCLECPSQRWRLGRGTVEGIGRRPQSRYSEEFVGERDGFVDRQL
jgi:hypothetical protein